MYDLLIKGGLVADGTGAAPAVMDVAVTGDRIVAVGPNLSGEAREVVDATGKLVTPGFVDVHTHYDGQVTWDEEMLPSSAHGVTTAVFGCCGIGFAPVRKGSEDFLIQLMEGVEDIPGAALHVGVPWGWETFPEYLDTLAKRKYALNIAAQVPHSAVRAYVLGDRAALDEPATDAELAQISGIVGEAIAAGAVGVGTSRVALHRSSDGSRLPGTRAPEEELLAIAQAMRDAGGGVLQIIPSGIAGGVEGQPGEAMRSGLAERDAHTLSWEVEMMRRLHAHSGQTITFTFAYSSSLGSEEFQKVRGIVAEANRAGEKIFPQFAPRSVGGLVSLDSYHVFTARPSYAAIAHLPRRERARLMADPALKAKILAEGDIAAATNDPRAHTYATLQRHLSAIYDLRDLNYEPLKANSVTSRAQAEGRDPMELIYDLLIADQGEAILIWFASGYVDGDLRIVEDLLEEPTYIPGLGDAGAHVRFICDGAMPTFLLAHWARDRTQGKTFPIELLVRKLTKDPAELYHLHDRGVIREGLRADLNVIDFGRLAFGMPRLVNDLPAQSDRFLQPAEGYDLTVVGGVVTRRDGRDTGERPGRLLRNPNARSLATA